MNSVFGKKAALGLLVALFLTVNVGGVFAADMTNGVADNCPYMGAPTLCAMSPLQHLSEWQQTFAAVAQRISTEVLLLLAFGVAALFWVRPLVLAPAGVKRYLYHATPPPLPQDQKILHWLSLFENSPSQV